MYPIAMAGAGETVLIRKITGDEKVRQHLAELGFVVDEEVTVVSATDGNLIVKVKDARVAIGLGMANRILV
jgi:ferrous iron transport protein A